MVLNVATLDLTSGGGHHSIKAINNLFHNGFHLHIFTDHCFVTAMIGNRILLMKHDFIYLAAGTENISY